MRLPRRRTAAEGDQESECRFSATTRPRSRSNKGLQVAPPSALALRNCSLSQCSLIETVTQSYSLQLTLGQSRFTFVPGGGQDRANVTVEVVPDPVKIFCRSVPSDKGRETITAPLPHLDVNDASPHHARRITYRLQPTRRSGCLPDSEHHSSTIHHMLHLDQFALLRSL
jgi:hypothetical protein